MIRQRRRRAGTLAGLALAVLVSGCGSTVSMRGAARNDAPLAAPAVLPTTTVGTGTWSAAGGPSSGLTATGAGDASAASVSAGTVSVGRTVAAQAPLTLGFVIPTGNTYNDPVTGTQSVTEDFSRIIPALLDDLNRHGGIAGRRVEWIPATMPSEVNSDQQMTDEQAACQNLTQDHKVFAVVAIFPIRYSTGCYVQNHTPVFVRPFLGSLDDLSLHQSAPWVIGDDSPDLDTMARLLVAGLVHEHAMSRRIGIAESDTPLDKRVVRDVLVPAIQRAGGKVLDEVAGQDDLEHATASSTSAVLQWKSDHVDTVIPFDLGPAWGVLGTIADQQQFYPRWVLDSSGRPQWVLNGAQDNNVAPPPSERKAIAVGFAPAYDVLDADYPLFPAEQRCLDVVNAALGTTLSHRAYGQGAGPLVACRMLALVRQALAPYAGQPLHARDVAGDVLALRDRYVPLDIPRSSFAPGKPDGIAVYRTSHYVDTCTCMRYDAPWTLAPSRPFR